MAQWSQRELHAVVLKLLACLCFAAVNGLARVAAPKGSGALSTALAVFLQNAVTCAISLVTSKGRAPRASKRWVLHAIRSGAAVAGMASWYASLKVVSFSRGAALGFLGPVVTTFGCVAVLGEELTWLRAVCLALSFAGTLLVTRPDVAMRAAAAENPTGAILAAFSAVCFAASNVAARALAAAGEKPAAMVAELSRTLAPATLLLLVLPAAAIEGGVGGPPWLTLGPIAAVMGALSYAAHLATAHAYARADVLLLAPFGMARLAFSALVGYVAFGEDAEPWPVVLGSCALASACVLLAREHINFSSKSSRKMQ